MREELYRKLSVPAYNEWAKHYRDTGFAPQPIREALALSTAMFVQAHTPKDKPKPKVKDFVLPRPYDDRKLEEKVADWEEELFASAGVNVNA